MKVAICYTKRRTDQIMESFTQGIVDSGDHVEIIKSKRDLHKLERCEGRYKKQNDRTWPSKNNA
jgi:hypothetical protein